MRQSYSRVEAEPFVTWWREQYEDLPGRLAEATFWRRGRWNVWVASPDVLPGDVEPVDGVGIPFLRTGRQVWKPTQIAAIEFGSTAARNVVDLAFDEMITFLDGGTIRFAPDDARGAEGRRGFVVARHAGVAFGCGLWRQGTLESAVPKGRQVAFLDSPIGD
jgi:NOL1/NOP2/fmu family ribosome biogenesis protein